MFFSALHIDCFFIGLETTSRAMYALISIWITHPNVQQTAYEEIKSMIGAHQPTIEDRKSCSFIESMTLETLRFISHAPLPFHMAMVDTSVQGYHVPKGSTVGANYYIQ